MDQYYYELIVETDKYIDILESYILDISSTAIERKKDGKKESIILRTEQDPQDYEKKIVEHCELLGKMFEEEIKCITSIQKKNNKDWVQGYKDGFSPLEIGKFYIHATWHDDRDGKTNIVLDPELSFGTGHHETTRVCLKAIEKYVKSGQTFMDVGCGSGILSIAAAKLGAEVSLCDIDTVSVENARTNLQNNGIKAKELWEGSVAESKNSYDIIVANIVSDILIFLKKDIIAHMKKGSYLILSGILEKYEERVKKAYSSLNLTEIIRDGEWICLVYKKEE